MVMPHVAENHMDMNSFFLLLSLPLHQLLFEMRILFPTLLLFSLLAPFSHLHSQEIVWDRTAKFRDSTIIRYNIESLDLTDATALHFSAMLAVEDAIRFANVDFFAPGKMTLRAYGGISYFGGEGFFYLANRTKTIRQNLAVKKGIIGYDEVNYVISEQSPRTTSFGIHGGYAYKSYGPDKSVYFDNFPFTTNELTLGLAMTTGRYMHIEVEDMGKMVVTSVINISADVHFYAGSATTGLADDGTKLDPKDISHPIGFSVTMDGRKSIGRTADFGLTYLVGGGICALGSYPKFGFGLYFGLF